MQKSKSILSFLPNTEHREPARKTRPSRRSSLDTFIIPGRTRLPSSKSSQDATDIQIAQALLNHNAMQASKRPSRPMPAWADFTHGQSLDGPPSPKSGNGRHRIAPPSARYRPRTTIMMHSPPSSIGRPVIIVPPRRRIQTDTPQALTPITTNENIHTQTYDGANDGTKSGHASRMTSMTWSTVSHRVVSNSSGSSRASRVSEFKTEYNSLAVKHGLPLITGGSSGAISCFFHKLDRFTDIQDALDEGSNSSQTKITQKSHHGWLARKIFRRSSSTYTLKAKTTYRPVTRKKSLGGLHLLSSDTPTRILTGKSLEEISRLGGLGILTLPPEFAVDKLTLPTCLSASAAYLLEYGCNAPGLFRVSGTATTINGLYNFYDHQFSDAGSPSRVEETVGSGLLPSEPEHTLPDIASLFKKIIIGLPGGLLGSLELFEAFRGILVSWHPDPEMSLPDATRLQAKLIALAISSVPSLYRVYLIQAVLGLVAYFGFEADQAQIAEKAEKLLNDNQEQQKQQRSEIMGYQSLGVVLGPLLLGDLTDSIDAGAIETHDSTLASHKSSEHTESPKKSKKQKRNSIPSKLDKDTTLSAHVDRANLTAKVMHLLLINWKEVVNQLRELNDSGSSFLQAPKSRSQTKKMPSRTASRLTLKTSDEETRFMDLLRGCALPEDFGGTVKVKRKVRISSRSPMCQGALNVSEDNNTSRSWLPGANEGYGNERDATERVAHGTGSAISINLQGSEDLQVPYTEDIPGLDPRKRTHSDLAMDRMAMGTILTPLKGSSVSQEQRQNLRHIPSKETPIKQKRQRSSGEMLETAVKIAPQSGERKLSVRLVQEPFTEKSIPLVGDVQRAELPSLPAEDDADRILHEKILSSRRSRKSRTSSNSSPYAIRRSSPRTLFPSRESGEWAAPPIAQAEGKNAFPPRQSSLPQEQDLHVRPIDPIPTFESLSEYKAWSKSHSASPPKRPARRKTSEVSQDQGEALDGDKRNSTGSVKFLAQKFAEASRVTRNDEQARQAVKDGDIPKVYAYVHSLPSPKLHLDDPFVSSASTRSASPERESLIPKPVNDIGRGRRAESRSPFKTPPPPKRAAPPTPKESSTEHSQVYGVIRDEDAEIVRGNTRSNTSIYSDAPTVLIQEPSSRTILGIDSNGTNISQEHNPQILETSIPHFLSAYSAESLRCLQSDSEDPETGHSSHARVVSNERSISTSHSDVSSATKGVLTPASPSRVNSYHKASDALKSLERHGSLNATLFQEIRRLQRLLEQRGEEVQAARRSLDAARESREARETDPGRASPRGSWSKGTLNEEIKEAKRELSIWKRRAEEAERRLAEISGLAERVAERHGVNVEVLVDREGAEQETLAHVYVDEGWGSVEEEVNHDVRLRGG